MCVKKKQAYFCAICRGRVMSCAVEGINDIYRYASCACRSHIDMRVVVVYLDLAALNTHCDTSHISERVIMIDIRSRTRAELTFFFETQAGVVTLRRLSAF